MEILKRGTLPWKDVYQFKCAVCGTVFRASGQEVTHEFEGYDDWDRALWRAVTQCPVCHQPLHSNLKGGKNHD